jgi:hypothetical protein
MIIVAMTMGTSTFAINFGSFRRRLNGQCEAMGGTKVGADCEISFHSITFIVCPKFGDVQIVEF